MRISAEWAASGIELLGVVVMSFAVVFALGFLVWQALHARLDEEAFRGVRLRLGRGILLGLEFLVAGDIVHTVAVELTPRTVGVLAMIVLIRPFLSFALEVELDGRWPWRRGGRARRASARRAEAG